MIDLTDNATMIVNEFGGSEKKCTVIYNERVYMVKFPDPVREKNNELSYMNNAFSEDIGCKIFKSLGFETQNTFLAKYNFNGKERIVVACEDFCRDGAKLIEFNKLLLSDMDSPHVARRFIPIELVIQTIENLQGDEDKTIFKEKFWKMFVVDTLIGNSDRHTENWGFLKQNGNLKFAPIYDCGSALSSLLSDSVMQELLSGAEYKFKAEEYNLTTPYSYKGQKIFYPDFYKNAPLSLQNAVKQVVPKINMDVIKDIINSTEGLSDIRRKYLTFAVNYRYEKILVATLKRIIRQEKLQQQEEQKTKASELEQNKQNEILENQYDARFEAIKNIDLSLKARTIGERLRQFCKKSMLTHGDDYTDYVVDGVKAFLLSSPDVKLEQMTDLIDKVAPMAVYNSAGYKFSDYNKYSDYVKSAVRGDKEFRKELSRKRESESRKFRETSHR